MASTNHILATYFYSFKLKGGLNETIVVHATLVDASLLCILFIASNFHCKFSILTKQTIGTKAAKLKNTYIHHGFKKKKNLHLPHTERIDEGLTNLLKLIQLIIY